MSKSPIDLEKLFRKIAGNSQLQEVMDNLKGIGVIASVKDNNTYVNTYAVFVEKSPSSSGFPGIGKLLHMKRLIQENEEVSKLLRRCSFAVLEFGRSEEKEYFMQCLIAGPRYYCVRFTNAERSSFPKDGGFRCLERSASKSLLPAGESPVERESVCLELLDMMIRYIDD